MVLLALLLAAAPAPKVLAEQGPIKLLSLDGTKTQFLSVEGAAVVVVVKGSGKASPVAAALKEGDALYAAAPGKWTWKPGPKGSAVVLQVPGGTPAAPVVRSEKDGPRYRILNGLGEAAIVIDPEQIGGAAVSHQRLTLQHGSQVPPHQHVGSAEILYALSGESEVTVDGEVKLLKAGDSVIIPAGVQHSAKTTSADPFKALQFYVPGGPEQRFKPPAPVDAGTTAPTKM